MKEFLKRFLSSIVMFPLLLIIILTGSITFILFTIVCFIISNYEWYKIANKKFYYFYGLLFIFFSFYTFYRLRYEFDYSLTFLVIFICIFTDLGGYFFGKILKGPKLLKISPNKTYTGLVGSFVFPLFFLFFLNEVDFFKINIDIRDFETLVFIFIISAISQLGDIIFSYFKRKSNLKDTGNIIPGHGGLLDRIDGMIFVIPISYLIFKLEFLNFIQ